MSTKQNNYFKFTLSLIFCLLVRLIPFRAPNIEPILATSMPISRAYGAFFGFFFGVLSIVLYDVLTHSLGVQTLFTGAAYGIVGIWASSYFKKEKNNLGSYVRFAIIGTLFFDAFTGLTVGPIFFHQTIMGALVGQIPFTALHLLGNVTLATLLSPGIYHYLIRKRVSLPAGTEKENLIFTSNLNPKII